MRLINPEDSDNRENLAKLEKTAHRASALIEHYESVIQQMKDFANESGVPADRVEQINPIGYCHEVLSTYAIQKLKG